jgi:hypothetical protein
MIIKLPDFKNVICQAIVACGEVTTTNEAAVALLKSRRAYETVYSIDGKKRWALAIFGGGQDGSGGKHFHLEATSKKPLNYKSTGADHIREDEFNELLHVMIGAHVEVTVRGLFQTTRSKVPADSFIRPRFFKVGKEPSSIKTVGMEFEFDGMGISRLTWKAAGRGNILVVELSGRLKGKVDSDYLVGFMSYLENAFRALVLEENSDA